MRTLLSKLQSAARELDRHSPTPRMYPWMMSKHERRLFDEMIRPARHYLEFGTGGSTLRALTVSDAQIYAVESSPEWLDTMRRYKAFRLAEHQRLHVALVDIGPVGAFGYPLHVHEAEHFGDYSRNVFNAVDPRLVDCVLVDGRFRVACTLQTILACHANRYVRILIHDFWNRPQYHGVLNFLDVQQRVDTLGVFSIKNGIDLSAVQAMYESYRTQPD